MATIQEQWPGIHCCFGSEYADFSRESQGIVHIMGEWLNTNIDAFWCTKLECWNPGWLYLLPPRKVHIDLQRTAKHIAQLRDFHSTSWAMEVHQRHCLALVSVLGRNKIIIQGRTKIIIQAVLLLDLKANRMPCLSVYSLKVFMLT